MIMKNQLSFFQFCIFLVMTSCFKVNKYRLLFLPEGSFTHSFLMISLRCGFCEKSFITNAPLVIINMFYQGIKHVYIESCKNT